jgi:hypothetical protein
MPMPKAPVDKDACSIFPQHQVRMPRQPFMIQSISETTLPQPTPHNHFWLRILIVNRRHILMPLLWSEVVHILYLDHFVNLSCKLTVKY